LVYGETHGFELTAKWKLTDRWTLAPGYAFEALHMHTDPTSADTVTGLFVEGSVPDHTAQIRSHFDLRKSLALDASAYEVRHLDHQGPASNVTIPAYTRLDVGLTWKPWELTTFSLVGQNLLKDHHLEFEDVDGALQSSQIRRSGYAKVTWRF
jgi:outer membrane receptor for monomeric catechols